MTKLLMKLENLKQLFFHLFSFKGLGTGQQEDETVVPNQTVEPLDLNNHEQNLPMSLQ